MHASKAVQLVEKKYLRDDHPQFRAGDIVKIHAKIIEGTKERIQIVEGAVIRVGGKGLGRALTIRKISGGVGVEILYPIHSQKIAQIELVNRGKVRQGRIYYLRERTGRAARIKSRDRLGLNNKAGAEGGSASSSESSSSEA